MSEKIGYIKQRYQNDEEFRERMKQHSKNNYKRRTSNCKTCGKRFKIANLAISETIECFKCRSRDQSLEMLKEINKILIDYLNR